MITEKIFGELPDGRMVKEFLLKNASGITINVLDYGCIIRRLLLPDKNGVFEDVVLGFDTLAEYEQHNYYMGAIVGRYANRIAGAKFTLDKKVFTLAANNGNNHLHGGITGFDKVIWQCEPFEAADSCGLNFRYRSTDMEEGYPGNLDITVTYSLTNDDELIFDYKAVSDKKTIINLTNHAYYNLAANSRPIVDGLLKINASEYLAIDNAQIPIGKESVAESPFDFRAYRRIGDEIDLPHEQLKRGYGYDHCWALEKVQGRMSFAASLQDTSSGRQMDIFTEEPGIQLYTCNFLQHTRGKGGVPFGPRTAVCLETQHFPDSPNRSDFPSVELAPGQTYQSRTLTKFSVF